MNVSISRRYARALIAVAGEQGHLDEVGRQLQSVAAAFQQSSELATLAANPYTGKAPLWAVMERVLRLEGAPLPLLTNLVRTLIDRRRLAALPELARIYASLADAHAGRLRGQLTSAVVLPQEAIDRLEDSLGRLTQRDVVLEPRVDPALLGGISARLGSSLYDGSLRSQLDELRRSLKQI